MTDDERRQAALALLTDRAYLACIEAQIAALDGDPAPCLAFIAGAERARSARRVGVLAGSFNPPTVAHVALAESARAFVALECVIWVISRVTVDKESVRRAPLASRLAVLAALARTTPHMAVALVNRGLYADQAAAARSALPQLTDLTFILGFDKIVQILDPHYYRDRDAALDALFALTDLLVAPRGAATSADLAALFAHPENLRWAGHARALPFDAALRDVASSVLRARIARGEPIAADVPPEALALVDAGAFQ